jgi:hypothetical protein
MGDDEEFFRELFGKALGEGFRAVMDMQLYGEVFIGPDGRRVEQRRAIDLPPPVKLPPLKGEVRGGRWDGLDIEAS